MNTNNEQVMQIMREVYSELDGSGDIAINPAVVAARTMGRLDPDDVTPPLVGYLAVLEMRQLARAICRRVSCTLDTASSAPQPELFDGELQRRYPALRNDEEVYVLREAMTLQERRAVAARLRSEGKSKMEHARALDAETNALVQAGVLAEAA